MIANPKSNIDISEGNASQTCTCIRLGQNRGDSSPGGEGVVEDIGGLVHASLGVHHLSVHLDLHVLILGEHHLTHNHTYTHLHTPAGSSFTAILN